MKILFVFVLSLLTSLKSPKEPFGGWVKIYFETNDISKPPPILIFDCNSAFPIRDDYLLRYYFVVSEQELRSLAKLVRDVNQDTIQSKYSIETLFISMRVDKRRSSIHVYEPEKMKMLFSSIPKVFADSMPTTLEHAIYVLARQRGLENY